MATRRINNFHSALATTLILFLFVGFFVLREPGANNSIPDVVEPHKPQKVLRVPILLYHYVEYVKDEKDTIRKSLNITPYTFDLEVKTLKDAGFNFITMSDLADALDDKTTISPKSVILTFDDGYRDFYTDVLPILKKYQVKAVAFVVPNFIDRPNNLTARMLSDIAKSELVEIGAHTMNHTYLAGLSLQTVKYEVELSKNYLERNFGIRVVSFAYPYGAFDNVAIDVVKNAGFKSAVTTIDGIYAQDLNRFSLNRIRPGGRVGQELLGLLEGSKLSKN